MTAPLGEAETTVEQTRWESAALSRGATETAQKFLDNLEKQHTEFVLMHSVLVKSHTIHSGRLAKVGRHTGCFRQSSGASLGDSHDVAGMDPESRGFFPEEHGSDRQGDGEGCTFQFLLPCIHFLPFWNKCLVSYVPLCLCIVSEGWKEARASF